MLTGEDQRYLAPCAALTGAALLSAAATFGEIAVPTVVLPIGAVTSFIGAPFFIFMILRFRKELF
jgi:iron complex transport system permease protein